MTNLNNFNFDKKINEEKEVLVSFKDGKKIEKEEYSIIKKYATIGVIKFGFSFNKKEGQAALTQSGKVMLGLV